MKISFAAFGMSLLLAAPLMAQDKAATPGAPESAPSAQSAASAPDQSATPASAMKAKARTPAGDEEGVKAAFTDVAQAWNTGDAKGIASRFTPDSSYMNGKGDEGKGKKEIQKLFGAELEGPMKGGQMAFDDFQIRFWNSSALVDCTATVTGLKKEDGTDAEPAKLHVFAILVNRSGKKWEALVVRTNGMHQAPAATDTTAAPAAASTTPAAANPAAKPAAKDSNF